MTETVRYTKIFAEDVAWGTSAQNVELQGGEVVALSEINLTYLHDSDNNVLYASSDGTTDDTFNFDPTNNRLFVPEIAGGTAAGDDVRIKGTSHATAGFVTLNEDGGNVGIGIDTPTALLHAKGTSPEILIDESSTGDPQLTFALSSVDTFVMGIDNSDSDTFKLESGGTLGANNHFVMTSAGKIGLGIVAPEAALHVFVSNAAIAPQSDADDFFVETSTATGITIGSGSSSSGNIRFADSGSANAGNIEFTHVSNHLVFGIAGNDILDITAKGLLVSTNTDSADITGIGVVINNGINAIVLKNVGGVAHGMTSLVETDTYSTIGPVAVSDGGIEIEAFTDNEIGIELSAKITTEDTGTADSADAAIVLSGATKSGTSTVAMSATANIMSVDNSGTAVVLFKGDGDVHNSGGSTAMGVYDDYDDAKLIKAVKGVMDHDYGKRLGNWVEEHTAILERGGIITRGASGGWFISQRGWRGLLCDAIGQLDARLRALESTGA